MGRGQGRGGFDIDDVEPHHICATVSCCSVLIIASTLFGVSFSTLHPHEWGLRYNAHTVQLRDETYESGRYFLGVRQKFFKFPRKLQYVEFANSNDARDGPVSAWSKDGQEVEVGFYYRLQEENVTELYYRYEQEYANVIDHIAANVFRDVATQFETVEFFLKRSEIAVSMGLELQARLRHEVFVDVTELNVLAIDVPDGFEEAVLDKVIREQEKKTLEVEQQSAVIQRGILVIRAEADRNITEINAAAAANGAIIRRGADADVLQSFAEARAELLANTTVGLGFTMVEDGPNGTEREVPDPDRALQYIYSDLVRGNSPRGTLLVNFPSVLLKV